MKAAMFRGRSQHHYAVNTTRRFTAYRALFCALTVALSAACTPVSPLAGNAGILISIDADPDARAALGELEVVLETSSPDSSSWRMEDSRRFPADTTADPEMWPLEYRLKLSNAATKFRATATATDGSEAIVAQARVIADASLEPVRELRLRFDVECLDRSSRCEQTLTCVLGQCVDAAAPLQERTGEPPGRLQQGVSAVASEACATDAARSCARDSETQPLVCRGSKWEPDAPCEADKRCDRSNASTQGTCQAAISQCMSLTAGALFCDAQGQLRECIDHQSASIKPCGDNETCLPMGQSVGCDCKIGSVRGQQGCATPSNCENNGGCDIATKCDVVNGAPTCTECPSGFSGTGQSGCAPLLSDLVVSPGQLDPPFDPNTRDYRVLLPTFAKRLSITAKSAVTGTLTVNSLEAKLNEPGAFDLPAGLVTLPVTLAAESGARSDYNLTIVQDKRQETYLKASNTRAGDGFGMFVAAYGDVVVVGAPFEAGASPTPDGSSSSMNAGAAYVFVREGDGWRQQAYLKAKVITAGDLFGTSVAIWGDTIAVGAPGNIFGSFVTGANNGAVHIFGRNGDNWEHQQIITSERSNSGDAFGFFVRLKEDSLGVGAPLDDEGGLRSGAGYLFARNAGVFEPVQRFKAQAPESEARFGSSISFDGDMLAMTAWSETVDDNTRAGAVYLYERTANGWPFFQRVVAPNAHAWAQFGGSVELSGDMMVVSAPHASVEVTPDHHGEVHVFKRSGAEYLPTALMTAMRPTVGDCFGNHMSMTATQLLVGSAIDADSSAGAGAAYLYTRTNEGFEPAGYMTAAHGDAQDQVGFSVGLSDNFAVVAAPYEDSSSNVIDEGATDNRATDSGAVHVFR
jgi:hypothetical protein